MRTLLGLTLLTLAALSVFVFAPGGTSSAQVPDTEQAAHAAGPTRGEVCYSVERGHDVKVDARLITDNFGGDRVTIGRLVLMCELSGLGPAGTAPAPPTVADTRILACYTLRDGGSPDDPYRLATDFFKDAVVVTRSELMCETAAKYVTDELGNVQKFGTPSGRVSQCYNLKGGDNVGRTLVTHNNNFGRDEIVVGAGALMCEEAEKHRIINGVLDVTGFANGVVDECFRIASKADPQAKVVLETENFGRAEVLVRSPRMLCVHGEKAPIYIGSITTGRQP